MSRLGARKILKPTGPAVGVIAGTHYEIEKAIIEKGEMLFGYTDGLTDTVNPQGEYFGTERWVPLLALRQALPALLEQIQRKADEFSSGAKQTGDITMLAVSRRE